MNNNLVNSRRTGSAVMDSWSKPRVVEIEKRHSLSLPARVHITTSKHQSPNASPRQTGNDGSSMPQSKGFLVKLSSNKLRRRESAKVVNPTIYLTAPSEQSSTKTVSGPAVRAVVGGHRVFNSIDRAFFPGRPTSLQRQNKAATHKKVMTDSKRDKACTHFFKRLLACTNDASKSSTLQNEEKLVSPSVKSKPSIQGTGSNLRDLQFYIANESFRVCKRLCRIPDEDDQDKHNAHLSDRLGSLGFKVRQFAQNESLHTLFLPFTIYEDTAGDDEREMMRVFMSNFISMLPVGCDKISRKANPSGLVFRLLPFGVIPSSARYLGAAFWLWLCAIDDIIEPLEKAEFELAIAEIKKVFSGETKDRTNSAVVQTSFSLRDLVRQTDIRTVGASVENEADDAWRQSFLDAIMEVLYAFEGERPLLEQFKKKEQDVKLADWMVLRLVTISARPFMVLARASLGLPPTLSPAGNTFQANASQPSSRRGRSDSAQTFTPDLEWEDDISRLELFAQCAMGLQNDILGWEKDHAEENILNSVEILYQIGGHRQSAMREMVLMHNHVVNQMCHLADGIMMKQTLESHVSNSPTRSLFRMDTLLSPLSPRFAPPTIYPKSYPSPVTSPVVPDFSEGTLLQRIKSKIYKPEICNQDGLTDQAKYVMVLLSFVQGMAVWTSKAKRYAV